MQSVQELIFRQLRVTTRHALQAHHVHWDEDRVDAEERDPEVNAADAFVHEAAEHLGEPEVERRKHAEDRRYTHYEVEVRRDDVSIVHRQVKRALAQDQSGNTTGDEQRNETDRKKHRGIEANAPAPQRAD